MDKDKLIKILSSIFVAIIFLASYAAIGGSGLPKTSTTTTVPQSVYAIGLTNASITGYGSTMFVTINCNSTGLVNSTAYLVSNTLTALETNGSISDYLATNQTSFTVHTNRFNSPSVYSYITSRLNTTSKNCTSFKAQALIALPNTMNFAINGQNYNIQVPSNKRNYTVSTKLLGVGKIPVRVSALVTYNGTIFGNLSVRAVGG